MKIHKTAAIILTTMVILTTSLQKAPAPLLMYDNMTIKEFKENLRHYDADRDTWLKENINEIINK
jgi:hypothetical protein